ncbi:hypothetical protein KP005_02760 [Geomonas nitrogeniifigens]|uniref:Uncharacterized protein n=1 Tax=Geomonas diazotrophica TaxID=2843197 RepID=A0ABX8JIL4_9BACT|nr:hypothetical protein [Geomonas nitrogeniifigens]QWV98230.1 hypothetical protein KP005_02760 [Geomonas nitrogeniifigens]
MPELMLLSSVVSMLKETNYDYSRLEKRRSPVYFIKNSVLNCEDGITIIDKNAFEVIFTNNHFNEMIFAETLVGTSRIERQKNAVLALTSSEVPKAWLLVSVYYHSFFCAILMNRLLGRYSCHFLDKDIKNVNSVAENPGNHVLASGNYVGYFLQSDGMEVRVRFKHDGEKPHKTAWQKLSEKVDFIKAQDSSGMNLDRLKRVNLFKSIIDSSNKQWHLPSDIRNHWNYADVSLFLNKGDDLAKEFVAILNGGRDIKWASTRSKNPSDSDVPASVAFISSTLDRALNNCKGRILG